MTNRRDFLFQAAAAGALALDRNLRASETQAQKPLRILLLGATGHIGPYFARAAVARGHHVSALVRKTHGANEILALPAPAALPSGVENLIGDRNGDLASIKSRNWDAVIDLVTYSPLWVKTLGEALRGRVRHYTFVSSDDVYVLPSLNGTGKIDEDSKLVEYTGKLDPYSPILTRISYDPSFQYGPLKALCEREAQKQFPGVALIVRPSAIVGPNDKLGAFTYLPARMQKGGEMLVTGDPLGRVQMIDIRDMAEWVIRMAEKADTGVFNVTGPALPMGWAEMLGAVRGTLAQPITLIWTPMEWLKAQNVVKDNYNNFLFWPSEGNAIGLMSTINDKARSHGLTFRPVGVTAADTLAWYLSETDENRKQLLGTFEDSIKLERRLLDAWHAQHGQAK